jgi:hypothetical protein
MQCGCQCIQCEVGSEVSTDVEVCNNLETPGLKCIAKDKDKCGPEYSDSEKIPFCAIPAPSRWPPLYALNNAVQLLGKDSEGVVESEDGELGGSPSAFSAEDLPAKVNKSSTLKFMYTSSSSSDFVDSVMANVVRQPDFLALQSEAALAQEAQVLLVN